MVVGFFRKLVKIINAGTENQVFRETKKPYFMRYGLIKYYQKKSVLL